MCGLAGFWSPDTSRERLLTDVTRMAGRLRHRGPDDGGAWVDEDVGLALGHRRLAILDLSPAGHQPMVSATGRYVLAYNGEIYNYRELRRDLEGEASGAGSAFRGHSDTEVILAAIEAWGLPRALECFIGMFAFALWDRRERRLQLVRDRLGIKPLFYGWTGKTLLFGSELKALRAHPDFEGLIDRGALALLLRHNCIPAPYSIYKGISKLPAGTIASFAAPSRQDLAVAHYWSARDVVERAVADPFRGTEEEAVRELETVLRDAVGLRMIADVPLGAFLSGGVDSSTVVALMQTQSERPVKTFSIGIEDPAYDEAQHAREVASHLGTDHTELYVTPREALDVVPQLAEIYDEPFADSSQIPTFLVSALARRHVKVSLSGDGGDELFAGYNRHQWVPRLWRGMRWIPQVVRGHAARFITAVPPERWDRAGERIVRSLPGVRGVRNPGYKMHKLAEVLSADGPEAMHYRLSSHWQRPEEVVHLAEEPLTLLTERSGQARLGGAAERMMFLDLITYLPDDILTKLDRASMRLGLEARVPLLDHRVVEFAWSLPQNVKLRHGTTKWALRQVLYRHVPPQLVERPKTGFGIPLDNWLRGPLRDWAGDLLDESRLRAEGFFEPEPIRKAWSQHLSGSRSLQYHLWDVLMFQSWLQAQSGPAVASALE